VEWKKKEEREESPDTVEQGCVGNIDFRAEKTNLIRELSHLAMENFYNCQERNTYQEKKDRSRPLHENLQRANIGEFQSSSIPSPVGIHPNRTDKNNGDSRKSPLEGHSGKIHRRIKKRGNA